MIPGEILALTIERPAVGGAMIARADGRVVLVTGAIPGERVRARVDRVTRGVVFATADTIEEPSPDRRPAFPDPWCGGCLYSHIAYARQLEIKGQVIADACARIGRIALPAAVMVASSPEQGYRMRARLHARGRQIGFFREGTHELCDARRSQQLLPATTETLERVGAAAASLGAVLREVELSENISASERVVHLEMSEPVDPRVVASISAVTGLTSPPYVTDVISIQNRPLALRRHVRAFFQGNRYLIGDLAAYVAALVPAGASVVDLYAGTGLFSVAAAMLRDATVTAVEADRFAAEDLQVNGTQARGQMTSVRADVESFVQTFRTRAGSSPPQPAADVAIVDPPRTGLSAAAVGGIIALAPMRLIYVSCDVATLARDSRRFVDGGYTIERADGFDLFPNTPHVETVVTFRAACCSGTLRTRA